MKQKIFYLILMSFTLFNIFSFYNKTLASTTCPGSCIPANQCNTNNGSTIVNGTNCSGTQNGLPLVCCVLANNTNNTNNVNGANNTTAFSIPVQIPTTTDDFFKIIIGLLIYIVPTIVLFVFMYAAYLFMTSKGDPKQVKKAMDIIKWAIIGFIAVILSWSIKNFIVDFFTK
jgi:hypothetical protein